MTHLTKRGQSPHCLAPPGIMALPPPPRGVTGDSCPALLRGRPRHPPGSSQDLDPDTCAPLCCEAAPAAHLEAHDSWHDGEHEHAADLASEPEATQLRAAPVLIPLALGLGDLLQSLLEEQGAEAEQVRVLLVEGLGGAPLVAALRPVQGRVAWREEGDPSGAIQ